MNDRVAFRALVIVAGLLLFCLGCLLTLPLKIVWFTTSIWTICCSILMAQVDMPAFTDDWFVSPAAILAGAMFTLMLGSGLLTAWRLWRATRQLIQTTRVACVAQPPGVTQLANQLKLVDSLIVVPNPVPFSFCYGLWRPQICLSLGLVELLTEAQLEAVLRHEAYHLQRREPLRMAVALCLTHFFFFVPLLSELRDRYLTEKEIAADAAAVTRTSQAALAGALYKLITAQSALTLSPLAVVAGLGVTAQRIDRLVNSSDSSAWSPSRWSILATLVIFVFSCLLMLSG